LSNSCDGCWVSVPRRQLLPRNWNDLRSTMSSRNVLTDALQCPAGYYCADSATTTPVPCPGGYFCIGGAKEPTHCTMGYYCPVESTTQTPCPEGHYCPQDGMTDAYRCHPYTVALLQRSTTCWSVTIWILIVAAVVLTFFVCKFAGGMNRVVKVCTWCHSTPRDEAIRTATNSPSQGDYGAIDAEERATGGGTDDEASGEDQPLPWWKRFLGIYQ
jgi:hypothetical protein